MCKLNIIIPTRERADTLFWSIKTCLEQNYDDFTIWVSDNCSNDNTREVVNSFNDPRIRYIRTNGRISMSHNWEFALEHIKEGFVTFIGDDDGILPGSLNQVAKLLNQHQLPAIAWQLSSYYWPQIGAKSLKGVLNIPLDPSYEIKSSKKELLRTASNVYHSIYLPSLYWGFIHIEIINKIKQKYGHFFHSAVPDFYSGVILAAEIPSYIYSNFPMSIRGLSKHSTGLSLVNSEVDNSSNKLFKNEENIPFHASLINCCSLALTLSECILQACDLDNRIPRPDIETIIEQVLWDAANCDNKNQFDEILSAIKQIGVINNREKFALKSINNTSFLNIQKEQIFGFDKKTNSLTINTLSKVKEFVSINNIYDAACFTSFLLGNPNYTIAKEERKTIKQKCDIYYSKLKKKAVRIKNKI